MDDQQQLRARAEKRVKELKGFYVNLLTYGVVNLGLFLINLLTSPGYWWFLWVMLGWGIGLVAHAAHVFGAGGLFGRDWEERKIQEIMDKEARK